MKKSRSRTVTDIRKSRNFEKEEIKCEESKENLFIDKNKTKKVESTSDQVSWKGETFQSNSSSWEGFMSDSEEEILDEEFCPLI